MKFKELMVDFSIILGTTVFVFVVLPPVVFAVARAWSAGIENGRDASKNQLTKTEKNGDEE